jgi:short subunit dehydrogenase-like uncharacterized protein
MTMLLKPTVLILGATGQVGRSILEHLKHESDAVHIRIGTRRPEQVTTFQQQGGDAVLLDLDSPAKVSGLVLIKALVVIEIGANVWIVGNRGTDSH